MIEITIKMPEEIFKKINRAARLRNMLSGGGGRTAADLFLEGVCKRISEGTTDMELKNPENWPD